MGDPATTALVAGQLGGPILSSLFANNGQERQSFERNPNTSPVGMMESNKNMLDSVLGLAMQRANGGVSLPSAYVQQPGAYSGGGLPLPIGLVASDPALTNQRLLRIPGFSGVDVDPTPRDRTNPPRNPTVNPDTGYDDGIDVLPRDGVDEGESGPFSRMAQPRGAVSAASTGPRRRSSIDAADGEYGQLVRASDLDVGGGDDLPQAMGSIQLLLEAFGGGRGAAS